MDRTMIVKLITSKTAVLTVTGCAALYVYRKHVGRNREYEFIPRNWTYSRILSYYALLAKIRTMQLLIKLRLLRPLDVRDTSRMIELVTHRTVNLRQILMDHFAKVHLIPVSAAHTHRDAAQLRTSANVFMNDAARKAGFTPYNVSRANHDIEGGSRYFYHQKDIATPFRDDKIEDSTAFIFCDVDFYCDMERWLQHFKPIMMYTLVPETTTYRGTDYSFRVVDDLVDYHVSGGAKYKHALWDYSGDIVSVVDNNGDLCVFNVEQKKLPADPNRRLIWLVPCARIRGPVWEYSFEPTGLKRKVFSMGGANNTTMSITYDAVTDRMSVARNGDWHSVELNGRTYAAIRERISHKVSPPVVADIERILRDANDKCYSVNAPLLFDLIVSNEIKPNVVTTSVQAAHFQPLGPLKTEDGKTTMQVISNPLVSRPAVAPTKGVNSDTATVTGRIHNIRNNVKPVKKYKIWARDFVNEIVPNPGKGVPITPDQVRTLQNGKQQQARYADVKDHLSTNVTNRLKAFIKSEAYIATNDPRNITTMSPEMTVMAATFTYVFKHQCLKRFKWYGPGLTPKQAATRLGDLARMAMIMLATDFSRFDGTISEFIVMHVIMACYMRWCCDSRKAELKGYFNGVYMQKGHTAEGIKFEPGYGTRSGGPFTTDGNELAAGFIFYCAFRSLGYSHEESMELIGLIFGDDGAQPEVVEGLAEALEQVAKDLGLTLKCVKIQRGDPLPYLGRYFVDPTVCLDSFQDPMRTLSKLHLTSNKSVTAEQALVNKAAGYITTDALTPIIGTWARKVRGVHGTKVKGLLREEQYKCSNAWPQQDSEAIAKAMAFVLGIEVAELTRLDMLLESSALDQMPALIDNLAPDKVLAVVDDCIVGPGNIQNEPKPDTTSNSLRSSSGANRASIAPTSVTTSGEAPRSRSSPPGHGDATKCTPAKRSTGQSRSARVGINKSPRMPARASAHIRNRPHPVGPATNSCPQGARIPNRNRVTPQP
jgi:hypothetical protein